MRNREEVTITQIEIVNKWLVNTPVITYDYHDTATPIHLPNESMLNQGPVGAILHIEHLALYNFDTDRHDVEIEMIDAFFKEHTLEVDKSLLNQLIFELAKISLQLL